VAWNFFYRFDCLLVLGEVTRSSWVGESDVEVWWGSWKRKARNSGCSLRKFASSKIKLKSSNQS
jgi:hypothetical protein